MRVLGDERGVPQTAALVRRRELAQPDPQPARTTVALLEGASLAGDHLGGRRRRHAVTRSARVHRRDVALDHVLLIVAAVPEAAGERRAYEAEKGDDANHGGPL